MNEVASLPLQWTRAGYLFNSIEYVYPGNPKKNGMNMQQVCRDTRRVLKKEKEIDRERERERCSLCYSRQNRA
jgi:hypothetical protein